MVVRKTVVGPAPTTAWEFTGTSPIGTFQLPAGGGDRTFASLPAGPYTITKTPKDGYSVTYKVNDGSTQSGTSATVSLTAGATVTVEFINTYIPPTPMWVSSIDMRLVVLNKNFTYATATVTVVDSAGPVAGATVTERCDLGHREWDDGRDGQGHVPVWSSAQATVGDHLHLLRDEHHQDRLDVRLQQER